LGAKSSDDKARPLNDLLFFEKEQSSELGRELLEKLAVCADDVALQVIPPLLILLLLVAKERNILGEDTKQ